MKKLIITLALFFGLTNFVHASGTFDSNPGTCTFNDSGIVQSCTDEPALSTYVGQQLHKARESINGDQPYLILYDNNNDMYYVSTWNTVYEGNNPWNAPIYAITDQQGADIFANILSSFGALVLVVVLISSTKFGIKLIKKLFPNAY